MVPDWRGRWPAPKSAQNQSRKNQNLESKMDAKTDDNSAGKCPVAHGSAGRTNRDWWPNLLD
ncbi:MAG: hypothetical protein E5X96_05240, partial [Mesorhizobium sp.]